MMHDSKKILYSALVAAILVFCWLAVVAEPQKTSTGFYWPTGSSNTKITAGFRDTYTQGGVTYDHLGTDWTLSLESKVYAVSDGLVLYVSAGGWGTSDSGNVALLVLHETTESRKFIAFYGHIQTNYKKGDKVFAGKEIGTIGPWSGGAHLHFGIYLSDNIPSGNFGRVVLGESVDPKFTDPTIFLTIKKPKNSGQININVDKPILEQPIKLPNTGSEPMPNYSNCKLIKVWNIKKTTGAYTDQVFYMACDGKNHLWVAGSSGFVVFDQAGNSLGYFKNLIIHDQNFNLGRIYAISAMQEKIVMLVNFTYKNKEYAKLLRFNSSTNPFSISYVGTEDEIGETQGKFYGLGYKIISTIHPITKEIFIIDRLPFGTLETPTGNTAVRLQKFSADGNFLWAKDIDAHLNFPVDIECDKTGNLIIADNDRAIIVKYDYNGNFIGKYNLLKGKFGTNLSAMCVDKFGRVIVAQRGGGLGGAALQVFGPDMSYIKRYQLPIAGNVEIDAMTIDSQGNIYLGNMYGKIYKISP